MDEYAIALTREYGPDILNELNRDKQKIVKDYPYYEKMAYYIEKTKEATRTVRLKVKELQVEVQA